jgi:hypothetical protein
LSASIWPRSKRLPTASSGRSSDPRKIPESRHPSGYPAGDAATFAWGLPLFYGRNVFAAIEGRSTPGGAGPYFAF